MDWKQIAGSVLVTLILSVGGTMILYGNKIVALETQIAGIQNNGAGSSSPSENGCNTFIEKISKLEEQVGKSLTASDLAIHFREDFPEDITKTELMSRVKELIDYRENVAKKEDHYAYKLFLVELAIQKFGPNSINPKITVPGKKGANKLIQVVLRDLGYHDGDIDGNGTVTAQKIREFQVRYNERQVEEEKRFTENILGLFGHKMLEAVRSEYRMT